MKPYPEYKDSGVEWIGMIPSGWEVKKLKYLSAVFSSSVNRHVHKDEIQLCVCHYPMVYNEEFINKNSKMEKGSCKEDEYKKYILKKGQVILTKDSESPDDIGIPCYIENDFNNVVCGYHLTIIQKKDKNINSKFLFRFIQSDRVRAYFEDNSKGITRYSLGKSKIENMFINIPLPFEQQKIASFLDHKTQRIDDLIEKTEKKIELLKEKRTALINHCVTKGLNPGVEMKDSGVEWIGEIPSHWESKKIKYMFKIKKDICGEEGHDVLSVTQQGIKKKDIVSGEGQLSMDYTKYQIVHIGDFVMNHMDLLTGYVDIAKFPGVTSPDYRVFSLIDEKCVDKYYLYLFQIGYKNEIFYGFGQGSSKFGRWRLPSKQFKNFKFPHPSYKEQKQIDEYLDEQTQNIDSTIEKETQRIELLKEYRQSLISAAVTGKIDVRDWNK
jgi:type I restriction enzyme S subunit